MNIHKISVRAIVTFFQVFLSVLIGGGIFDYSTPTLRTAAVSGVGAGLSVVYNALTQWLNSQPE